MTNAIPKISAVVVAAPNIIKVIWADGRADRIDLADWIAGGSAILARLTDPSVFATARIDDYGSAIAWGDDEDLAIDAFHLAMLV
jgi:hypothetical protein